jgi:spore photoproduct lyase
MIIASFPLSNNSSEVWLMSKILISKSRKFFQERLTNCLMNAETTCSDPSTLLKTIFVAEDCRDFPVVKRIIDHAGSIPVTILGEGETPTIEGMNFPKNLAAGKKVLFLCRNKGRFLKPCPATREYRCCDYQVLNIGMNCPMDCTYCILQAYMNNPWISFYVNVEDLITELETFQKENPGQFLRIGTGEFTDSMALDRLTGLSAHLIDFIRQSPSMVLELKTKSTAVDHLKHLPHNGRTIIAWSLNSSRINRREELHTASLNMRLQAAARCAEWGYRLAFHFDPIILHPDWQEEYRGTIQRLYETVPADRVAWISMGALRFLPALKNIAHQRFPGTSIFYEEFITGLDNKCRYFRSRRVELYRELLQELQKHAHSETCIYLCMESDEIWREVFGYSPESKGGLRQMLDRASKRFCEDGF